MELFTKYGHFLSAVIQVIMYTFAAEQIMNDLFNDVSGVAGIALHVSLIVVPLILVKFCEIKYAQSFMKSD